MIYGYYQAALYVFLIACLSDALDGLIARLTRTQTELGAFLDPVADKLLIVSSFVTLAFLGPIPVWLVIIVVSRDIILAFGSVVIYFTGHRLVIRPSISGKSTTVLQLLVVTLTLVFMAYGVTTQFLWIAYWATAALTIISGTQYVMRGMNLMG